MAIHVYIDGKYFKTYANEQESNKKDIGRVMISGHDPLENGDHNLFYLTVPEDEWTGKTEHNRIERIKKQYENQTLAGILNAPDDVRYLLSKLEVAEKALKHVRDYLRLEEKWEAAKLVDDSLQQIRS